MCSSVGQDKCFAQPSTRSGRGVFIAQVAPKYGRWSHFWLRRYRTSGSYRTSGGKTSTGRSVNHRTSDSCSTPTDESSVDSRQDICLSDVWYLPDIRCPGRHRTSGKYRKSDSLVLDEVHRISGRCRTSDGSGRTGRPESTGRPTFWLCWDHTGFPDDAGRPAAQEGPDVRRVPDDRQFSSV